MAHNTRREFLARTVISAAAVAALAPSRLYADPDEPKSYKLPRCRVTPQAENQTSIELIGKETTRWHFGPQFPRPFFYPFNGPSGSSLTRMGHPGAPNHDHHRSIWFAHHDVEGISFWEENGKGQIRQKQWLCYDDGPTQCAMAVRLGWFATNPAREIMEQTLVAIARPGQTGEHTLELQNTFRAIDDSVKLGKTNFGFLAVRVAKSISEFFGGGTLTDSEGRTTEAGIFGKQAQWVDYTGPVSDDAVEGITYFDHPQNPGSPTHWHVRADGWMGASFCMADSHRIEDEEPLKLRYLLHAHRGSVNVETTARMVAEFAKSPFYDIVPSKEKNRQFELQASSEV